MRIVVTGAAGFLGSHLSDRLLADGHEVVGLDNLVTGDERNIAHLAGNRKYRFVFHDVTEYIYLDGPVDAILHFASPASPIDYLQIPIQTLKVGALGTHKALGLARAKKARFLLASTSEVYGDPLVHPQPETYWGNVNPVGPRGCYDEAKRFAEAMTIAYRNFHGVDTRIVRIFNTYGPRMRPNDGRIVPSLIGQALRGRAAHDLRRRFADAVLLLRLGPHRRHHAAPPVGLPGPHEHRKPHRDDGPTVRRGGPAAHRHEGSARPETASRGRPEATASRHHAREDGPRLGAEGRSRRGTENHRRLLRLASLK